MSDFIGFLVLMTVIAFAVVLLFGFVWILKGGVRPRHEWRSPGGRRGRSGATGNEAWYHAHHHHGSAGDFDSGGGWSSSDSGGSGGGDGGGGGGGD